MSQGFRAAVATEWKDVTRRKAYANFAFGSVFGIYIARKFFGISQDPDVKAGLTLGGLGLGYLVGSSAGGVLATNPLGAIVGAVGLAGVYFGAREYAIRFPKVIAAPAVTVEPTVTVLNSVSK